MTGPNSILKSNRPQNKKLRPKTADRTRGGPTPTKNRQSMSINHGQGVNFSPYSVPNIGQRGSGHKEESKQVSFDNRGRQGSMIPRDMGDR